MGDFSYYYDIPFELDVMPEMVGAGAFGVFIIVYLLLMLFAGALSMVVYVLHSLSLYTIAGRRGIRHGWLAWIPMGNLWILGSIADQYQYVAKGKVKNRRKLLLGLSIGLAIGYFLWLFATLFNLAAGNEGTALLLLILGGLAIAAVAIWLVVCQYLAYYDYSSPVSQVMLRCTWCCPYCSTSPCRFSCLPVGRRIWACLPESSLLNR